MKQVMFRNGEAFIEEVPSPQAEKGAVLVKVYYSCISIGTEISGLRNSGSPLWKRALRQPENVAKAMNLIATRGYKFTRSLIMGRLSGGSPTGYSAAGIVVEAGEGVTDIKPGDQVACAGAQYAHHAEIICVPRNLVVPIPAKLDLVSASTVTVGAIAMQGVRRAQPTLGETFVVIGLGILGQLTAQLLRSNGCRVIGADVDQDRIRMAQSVGMNLGLYADAGNQFDQVIRLTDGMGADGVIITAASVSNAIVSNAFKMCRRKGRVVLVGDVGLQLNRADFYVKEIDFLISCSYGPGRYDPNYEEKGNDYPAAYVRWTENRNMAEYLRLAAENKLQVSPLISKIYPISEAATVYQRMKEGADKSLMVLFSYPQSETVADDETIKMKSFIANPMARKSRSGQVRIALIGAGDFAKGMHLPNLQLLSDQYYLQAVVSRSGHNAMITAKQFGAKYAATDYRQVLEDPEVDAVLIATRHHLHAAMVLEALKAGKHVLVEKPLSLSAEALKPIKDFYDAYNAGQNPPILLTGFNRRFSSYARRIHELIRHRRNPMILNYRMNAGFLPADHWVYSEEGGGRNLGEACHIYDLFTFFTDSRVLSIDAKAIDVSRGLYNYRDNFVSTMAFQDGSVASLTFTALGSKDYPKEQLEIFVDGRVFTLNDYKSLMVTGVNIKGLKSKLPEKGLREELESFAQTIRKGGEWPIPLWQQIQATDIALQVETKVGGTN
jgi:predicted dehydrogenase/threonine dehydrogenase-like Zn-dependent dehydrogenase